jgi:hypothetical protein
MPELVCCDLVEHDVGGPLSTCLRRRERDHDGKPNDAAAIDLQFGLSRELPPGGRRMDGKPYICLILCRAPKEGLHAEAVAKQKIPVVDCSLEHRVELRSETGEAYSGSGKWLRG